MKRLFSIALVVVIAAGLGTGIYFLLKPNPFRKGMEGVRESLVQGKYGLLRNRLAQLQKRFSNKRVKAAYHKLVNGLVRKLIIQKKYDEAQTFLTRTAVQGWQKRVRDIAKRILLARARKFEEDKNHAAAYRTYLNLFGKQSGDRIILRTIVKRLGAEHRNGATALGIKAAFRLARLVKGPLDDLIGRTLLAGLPKRSPYDDRARKIRDLLVKRFPSLSRYTRKSLQSKNIGERIHAYYLLLKSKNLRDEDVFRYHLTNLKTIYSHYRQAGKEAVSYFEKMSKRKNWPSRKRTARIDEIGKVKALHFWSGYQERVSRILVKAFLPEIKGSLLRWARRSSDYKLRVNAYRMLQAAGWANKVDPDQYHARNLTNFNPLRIPRPFLEAVSYFEAQVRPIKREKALKALRASRAYFRKKIARFARVHYRQVINNLKDNLTRIEQAINRLSRARR